MHLRLRLPTRCTFKRLRQALAIRLPAKWAQALHRRLPSTFITNAHMHTHTLSTL